MYVCYDQTCYRTNVTRVSRHRYFDCLFNSFLSDQQRKKYHNSTLLVLVTEIHRSHYRKTLGNKIVDNSDVVGASPIGAAPTTSSFST